MQIDFSVILKDDEGNDFTDSTGKPKELPLREVCRNSLNAIYHDEQNISGEEKFNRYLLAKKLLENGPIDISVEQVAKIKLLIGKFYGPRVLGAAFESLEG